MQSLQRKINADTAEIKGEEAPKGGLQRKINADTAEIKGEEAPKGGLQRKVNADTPKNGKKIVCSTGECVWAFGANIILHDITSLHHGHSITSYIISHQWHKKGMQYGPTILSFGDRFEEVPRHKIGFQEIQLRHFDMKKEIHCSQSIMFFRKLYIFTEYGYSSRSMKRREGVFFRRRLKNGMYVKFHAS
jgi:hypothetical protein